MDTPRVATFQGVWGVLFCLYMRVFLSAGLALAVGFLASEVGAFCRTTTAPLPPSYSPTRGCYPEGLPLFWRNACVGYSLQEDASSGISLEQATAAIDAAFATWTNTTCTASGAIVGISASNLGPVSCGEVRYNTDGPNQNVIVFREASWPYNDPNNTLGLTTITFNSEDGEIFDADMEINATGGNLSIGDPVPAEGFDFASVVTHEIGHFLGLAHATSSQSTMFASYRPGSSALRSLAQDDRDGLCAIYPTDAERFVDPSVAQDGIVAAGACDPSPRHGLTSRCSAATTVKPSNARSGCAVAEPTPTSAPRWAEALGLLAIAVLGVRRRAATVLGR